MTQGSGLFKSFFLVQLFTFLVLHTPSAFAQPPFQPLSTYSQCSSYVEDKALYIVGGKMRNPSGGANIDTNQAFAIDLTVSWDTSKPAYQQLASFNGRLFSKPSSLSQDGKRLLVLTSPEGFTLNLDTNQWNSILNITYTTVPPELAGVTDPDTGLIYVPFGYQTSAGVYEMLIVNLTDNSITSDSRAPTFSPQQSNTYYSVAWNKALGGLVYSTGDGLFSYNRIDGWKQLQTQGETPPVRYLSCLLSASGGSKLVLFGGRETPTISADNRQPPPRTLGDIYILDVATRTWKKGPPVTPDDGRRSASCAVANEQMIVWGGETYINKYSFPNHVAMVYDLKTDTWVSRYSAPSPQPTAPTDSDLPGSGAPGEKSNTAIIVGVVVAVLVVLLAIGGYVYVVRKRRSKKADDTLKEEGKEERMKGDDDQAFGKHTYSPSHGRGGWNPTLGDDRRYSNFSGTVVSSEPGSDRTLGPPNTVHQGFYGTQTPSPNPHTHVKGTPVDECIPREEFARTGLRDPHAVVQGGDDRDEEVEVYDSREEQMDPEARAI